MSTWGSDCVGDIIELFNICFVNPPKLLGPPPLAPRGPFYFVKFFKQFYQKLSLSLDMTSEGLEEMFEGDFADTCSDRAETERRLKRAQNFFHDLMAKLNVF